MAFVALGDSRDGNAVTAKSRSASATGSQHVAPLFSAKLVRWSEHPVLSKPPVIRGIIPADGSPARVDMSIGDQLRQRAAMGGERERAELAAFEALLSKCIADALVAQLRKEAHAHGVDVLTWLARDKGTDE